ncbi:MAG TPA: CpsB/CapC family capsule biosynthesis tyrosine phosphatase [Solirubrobacteraceae bacterium]|nr:CpsB/CapC family capsule biosynthesis tyrosine phosphatase [Solirubrobacteraceae bacterium]
MIDLHTHVLPGIDDGPDTIEGSLALARAAAASGTRVMVATPHVNWHHHNDAATIARHVDQLNERLALEGIALEIRPGAEIAMTRAEEIGEQELERLRIGGGPWILLEPPFTPIVTGLDGVVATLQRAGHRVVLAHPERCPALHRDPQMVESLVRSGVLTSVTAGSLVGRFGGEVRRFARRLVDQGLVHNVASDAHDAIKRPPGMAAELADAGYGALADWLTRAVPAAILSGEEIPARPETPVAREVSRRRVRWRRR